MKKQWWHEKVAYQIYPKSFQDSNGDGIGDIPGIISRLDYLKDLGVDIIWISPMYRSPFVDQGYDISNYYEIDPAFGTMEDMERLLLEAKKRDMYILMDLVVNHCSDQHEWFQKALADPDGPYGEYFYIKEGKPDCNWRSYFGGSVWENIPGTNKYYLHMFAKEQPDLNWENETVRKEIYKMMNWWLDKGLAGFRIDAIINIKKELTFSSMEPDWEDGLCSCSKMTRYARGIGDFLREMREETFERHNAFSIGELFDFDRQELASYIGDDGYFSSIFDFCTEVLGSEKKGWYQREAVTPKLYRDTIFESQKSTEGVGYLANIIENHDEPRGVSRYIPEGDCNSCSKKMLAAIQFFLKGLPFLYQGQEIGMTNNAFTDISEINDISTLDEYERALQAGFSEKEALKTVSRFSRDNARTPFQWSTEENAGFTDGTPWMAVNKNYKEINAASQETDENSVLAFYKKLIRLRKNDTWKEAIVYGVLEPVFAETDTLFAFYRKGQDKTLLFMANYQNQEQALLLPADETALLIGNYEGAALYKKGDTVCLRPYEVRVVEVADGLQSQK